jgi:hypothetical protein
MFIIFKHTTSGSCHWKSIYPNQKKNIKPFEAEMLTAKTTAFLPKSLEFANSPVSHHRR